MNMPDRVSAPAMPNDDDVNKRAYQRLPRPYPVEVAKLSFPMNKSGVIETTCCDISKGGLSVEAPSSSLAVGDTCQLKVLIPTLNKYSSSFFKVYENDAEQYFNALGEVAWIKPIGGRRLMGFRFVNVVAEQSQALERLIQKAFATTD
ncbi:PilZ domain-containing protein [Desulfovibrio sp. OttesenSCG-928-I05]|nr:PilZ domain-containing protein [Desulfovibrio sp. OttesenSCG-928-I05]